MSSSWVLAGILKKYKNETKSDKIIMGEMG